MNIGAGIIDSDFHGNICVVVFYFSNKFYCIQISDKVAQIVFEKISTPIIEEVYDFKEENNNESRIFGFGSTGL